MMNMARHQAAGGSHTHHVKSANYFRVIFGEQHCTGQTALKAV